MPRAALGIDALVEAKLGERDGGERFIELRSDLVRKKTGEVLWTSGGLWDRRLKRFTGAAERSKILRLEESQVEAARWFVKWFKAHERGTHLYTADGEPIVVVLLHGGRRGGKSNLAMKATQSFLTHFPASICWTVIPKFTDRQEILKDFEEQLPPEWYRYVGEPNYAWTFEHNSKHQLRSSWGDTEALKQGRADFIHVSEAQKHPDDVLSMVAPAIADRGGLVVLTANPPRTEKGEWVSDLLEKIKTKKIGAVSFELDPGLNSHVDHDTLRAMKGILSEDDYNREILGKFVPRRDVVMYGFSMTTNVAPAGNVPLGRGATLEVENITREVTRRHLGQEFDRVHGLDFQATPHMAATTIQFYRDPDDPKGFLLWYVDEAIVEQGTEDELVDALEHLGYSGEDALVPDASGDWQDAERTKGRASLDAFRKRGWRKIYLPDSKSRRNPPVTERLSIANAMFRGANGKIRAYVDPKCRHLIRALRLWPTVHGFPSKTSDYSHICDAATYPPCRFFPRRATPAPFHYDKIERPTRGDAWGDRDP